MSEAAARPLRIEFRRIQAISSRGNLRIRLAADGDLFAYQETRDCPQGEHWSAPWPAQPLRSLAGPQLQELATLLAGGGFFELPGRILRKNIVDEQIPSIGFVRYLNLDQPQVRERGRAGANLIHGRVGAAVCQYIDRDISSPG